MTLEAVFYNNNITMVKQIQEKSYICDGLDSPNSYVWFHIKINGS